MENFEEKSEKMIGARVPVQFAEQFSDYCKIKGIKQNILFHTLIKYWMDLPEPIQWLIYRGKIKEAHQQIAKEVEADQIVSGSEADASKQRQKQHRPRRVKSG